MKVIALDFFVSKIKSGIYRKGYTMSKFVTISELHVDDKVIPLSSNPKESGKTFTVIDLHPVLLGNLETGEYKTVAVTLWDQWREHTSRTMGFILVERQH